MKKVISVILLLTMLLPLCLIAFADEVEPAPTYEVSDSTSIAQDFEIAFGGKYKLDHFPPDPSIGDSEEDNDDVFLIDVIEHNYADKSKFQLYLYVYNPTLKDIDFDYEKNKVSMFSEVTGGSRKGHRIELVAKEGDGVLLKFKIADWGGNLVSRIKDRYYNISELELLTVGKQEGEATAYAVAMEYTFRENELGFLVQQSRQTEVVKTKVQHSYYRYQSDEYNEYCDLRSVYFNVPNEIIEEYGPMEAIRAEWEECQLYPVIVTNNQQVDNAFQNMILNKQIVNKNKMMFYYDYLSSVGGHSYVTYTYQYGFCNFDDDEIPYTRDEALDITKYLGGSFYRENINEPEKVVVSAAELKNYLDSKYGWNDYSFVSINKDHSGDNVEWFDVHTSIELDKYIAPETSLQLFKHRVFRTALEKDGENVETYTPLRKVNPADFTLGAKAFSKKYKVAEEDFEKILAAQEVGKTMYVLSYTVTDYKVYNDISWKQKPDALSNVEGDWDAFVADVVGIRDFDLIEAKYTKDGVSTIIPFVSSRTNAVPGISTPNVPKDPFARFWQIVRMIIIVLIVLVAIVIVIKIIDYIKRKRRDRYVDKLMKQEKG